MTQDLDTGALTFYSNELKRRQLSEVVNCLKGMGMAHFFMLHSFFSFCFTRLSENKTTCALLSYFTDRGYNPENYLRTYYMECAIVRYFCSDWKREDGSPVTF